ncbi:MAG TPA: methionine gamma-lyase family protein [Drouetiella sp.]|jgi:cystathionine beta-lyase family protein involved in aluminum resistance
MLKELDAAALIKSAEKKLRDAFEEIDEIALVNQKKVLDSFRAHRMTEEFFGERTGYGRNDPGRDAIDSVFAAVFESRAAAVRMQFVSGTHAIACALLGNLRAGDAILSLTGQPYDTLKEVIGLEGDESGNLMSLGVKYLEIDLDPAVETDDTLAEKIKKTAPAGRCMFYIQKSCGYSVERRSFTNSDIERLSRAARSIHQNCIIFVDNCYGEFVERNEPTAVGANLMAGSLIKNPGGGLAITGGYVAGDKVLVEKALNRLTSPGIGGHLGLTYNQNRLVLQGLFMAPAVVSNAVKGAKLFASVLAELGCEVKPDALSLRSDIIQAIKFSGPERLVNFCRAIQKGSPVNSHVTPEPWSMPGYQDPVIMAAGTFVEGATIELSADGPLRPPFAVFVQGGLTYLHVKCVLEEAITLSARGELPFF